MNTNEQPAVSAFGGRVEIIGSNPALSESVKHHLENAATGEAAHMPTYATHPSRLKGRGDVLTKNRVVIAHFSDVSAEEKAAVIHACNNHAALVEALEAVVVGLSAKSEQLHSDNGTIGALIDAVNKIARAALANLEDSK